MLTIYILSSLVLSALARETNSCFTCGQDLDQGDGFYDGCNTCTCETQGAVCTALACPAVVTPPESCERKCDGFQVPNDSGKGRCTCIGGKPSLCEDDAGLDECESVNALGVCPEGTTCMPDPKQCITTPCPQWACVETPPDCAAPCPEGSTCVYAPKECVTTPCPQWECQGNAGDPAKPGKCNCGPQQDCVNGTCVNAQACGCSGKRCPRGTYCGTFNVCKSIEPPMIPEGAADGRSICDALEGECCGGNEVCGDGELCHDEKCVTKAQCQTFELTDDGPTKNTAAPATNPPATPSVATPSPTKMDGQCFTCKGKKDGATFRGECGNTCTCMEGSAACTEKGCGEPLKEGDCYGRCDGALVQVGGKECQCIGEKVTEKCQKSDGTITEPSTDAASIVVPSAFLVLLSIAH